MTSSWFVPSRSAGPYCPDASSQVWLAGRPLHSPPMAWDCPPLRKASPTMNPLVAVTIARRAALFFRALTAIGCVPPVQCVSATGPLPATCARFSVMDRGVVAFGPAALAPTPQRP